MTAFFRTIPLFLAVLSLVGGCQPNNKDKVHSLPGLDMPLPSPWYSGYLTYDFEGETVHTHYVLIEAEDDDDKEKPLIYWSNGGPGASSLFGLLTELGPLLFSDLSLDTDGYKTTGIPTPIYNPYSWTRLGSVLIIDQPAPVGFSYCNNDTDSHACGDISWTDELASLNAFTALNKFYETQPCYSGKELYLTGESYGGIYIPTLARRIVESETKNNDEGNNNSSINLKGFAVGDGCLGTKTDICGDLGDGSPIDIWHILFLAGHHQIPLNSLRMVMKACREVFLQDDDDNFVPPALRSHHQDDDICKEALKKVKEEVGGMFEYSLYDECIYRNSLFQQQQQQQQQQILVGGGLNDYACGQGPVMNQYLALPVVKDALHLESSFFEVDNAEGFDYTPTEPDLTGFYKDINGKLRVLIYNGDTDPSITSFAAQNWTSRMKFDEIEEWRPWTVDGCRLMGGYVTRYEGNFDFLTIRGAGHMVPTYKPAATFTFLKSWIENEDYPVFDEQCQQPSSQSKFDDAAAAMEG